ncbi:MAG: DUF1328 domain-containing protein [Tatlockia sp.]|nr:DUF1328 domain-containing protein [Tatlockia sp.]
MFRWSFLFLAFAVVAAAFGYPKPPSTFTYIAKLFFFVFFFVFLAYLAMCIFNTTPQQSTTAFPTP